MMGKAFTLDRNEVFSRTRAAFLLLLPLLAARKLSTASKVAKGEHMVVMFSDRGVSRLTIQVLEAHGFLVSVHTSPIRPAFLDPRWEKVFVLQNALANRGKLSTVTWLDDDLLPDMRWLRRLVTNKSYQPIFAGYEYGRRKHRIMSNLLVFRTKPPAEELVNKWADAHVRYLNKTTGVQDQDGLNEIAKSNTMGIACISHSFDTVHTTGSSVVRIPVLDRAAREHLWRHFRVLPSSFFYSISAVLCLRAIEFGRRGRLTAALYNIFNRVASKASTIGLIASLIWLLLDSIPTLSEIGREPSLTCSGPRKVRRLGESTLSLGGRWLYAHGALVYADWNNRHEVICLSRTWGTFKQTVVVWCMENRQPLYMRLGIVGCTASGIFVGGSVRCGRHFVLAWRERPTL